MSNNVRVYELARETGLENKEVIRRLSELGIDAKTHSSSITVGDAQRLKESLGRSKADREEELRRKQEKEREELERFKNLDTVSAPEQKKAKKVLPPHLRKQQEEAEAAEAGPAQAPAASADQAEGPDQGGQAPAASGQAPPTPPGVAASPAAGSVSPPATGTSEDADGDEAAKPAASSGGVRMPGALPKPRKPGETPMRPPTPPRPAPSVTGEAPEAGRVHENKMPKEGSGKRSIPPPLRAAPARPAGAPARPGAPSRGGPPGRGGGPGRGAPPGSPYKAGRGPGSAAPARGGGPPGGGPGGSGGGPGSSTPNKGKTRRAKKTTPEEQELARGPRRRDVPIEDLIAVDRVDVLSGITVGELADKLEVPGASLVKKLFQMGEMATVQQTLPDDTVEIVCADLGVDVYFMSEEEVEFGIEEEDAEENLQDRPPVITVMGHVDHGKTLLLDAIREADVVSGEAGGITQHIGAYQVTHDGKTLTFIDTPGHAAFTAMRARGAQVTDIAIIVVAADDGVMPQTEEAIAHAKAAEVPIVVAVNKIDLENAQPDRVIGELTQHELIAEELGGEVPVVRVSAKTKQNLEELLEVLALQAEIMELRANPDKDARGRVIEAHLDKGRGPVATILIQGGTLNRGDILVAGTADGKIRAMFDEDGEQVDAATPGMPVQILGLNDVPEAGDEFRVVDAERFARDVAERRAERERRKELAEQSRPKTLEDLTKEVAEGEKATLNVIIKADVSGSAEALADALSQLELETVNVRVVHKGVGAVTENDITLAEASDAIVVAFNVRPGAKAREEIERSGVDLRTYKIIYEAIEDIELAVKGLLAPEFKEFELGQAEVREVFKVPKAGFVFGCMVTEGEIQRDAKVRVVREGVVVAEDVVESLRRFKDDVREVSSGYECGIGLDKFQDVKEGDVLEAFEVREIERV